MGVRKVLQNQIPAGWRVFMQEKAFISGKHSQEVRFGDCPSNSCVPQEAQHKKQLKHAQRHFICRQPARREHLKLVAGVGLRRRKKKKKGKESAFSEPNESQALKRNWEHGEVLWATGLAARARGRQSACARAHTRWTHTAWVRSAHSSHTCILTMFFWHQSVVDVHFQSVTSVSVSRC